MGRYNEPALIRAKFTQYRFTKMRKLESLGDQDQYCAAEAKYTSSLAPSDPGDKCHNRKRDGSTSESRDLT